MSPPDVLSGRFRKLGTADRDAFRDHLLRLDRDSRHMRFGHGVTDSFIRVYADVAISVDGVSHGYFADGRLRAVAELRQSSAMAPDMAEAAFSVEAGWQNAGLGTGLMRRLVVSARNRGIRRVVMYCLLENGRMRAVAAKHRAVMHIEAGSVVAEIDPPAISLLSLMREAMADTATLVENVLGLPTNAAAASGKKD